MSVVLLRAGALSQRATGSLRILVLSRTRTYSSLAAHVSPPDMHWPTTALKRPQDIPANWRDLQMECRGLNYLALSEEEVDRKHFSDPSHAHDDRLGIDLPALAYAACTAVGEWHMTELQLFSTYGVSNKHYLMHFESGRKIIGRIARDSRDGLSELQERTPRERLESEVATLTYVRLFCPDIPTPEVWAWNDRVENAVGAPYVLLDYVEGEDLEDAWRKCSKPMEKTNLLQIVAKHHAALATASLSIQGFGALRFTSPMGEERPLNRTDFRVGPFLSEARHLKYTKSRRLVSPPPTAAVSPRQLWHDLLMEERRTHSICWGTASEDEVVMTKDERDNPSWPGVDVTWNDIQTANTLFERLIASTRVSPSLCSPCIAISDYAFRNIIYDPARKVITGYIDWEGVSILPLYMMARYPDEIVTDIHDLPPTWHQETGGIFWAPPDCRDRNASFPPEYQRDNGYRSTFREALERTDDRLNASFWDEAPSLLKIQYLLLHGLNGYFTRVEWLKRAVVQAERKVG